jgi:hypothetical protein
VRGFFRKKRGLLCNKFSRRNGGQCDGIDEWDWC